MDGTEPARSETKALAAALVTVVLWASAFVGIRAAAVDFSPGSIAFARLLVGVLALGAFVVTRPWTRPSSRDLGLIVAAGVAWFAGYNVVLNVAERLVDAGTAAMLVAVGPIFIALFAGLFLGEGFPRRLIAGCLVAFAGAVVIGVGTSADATATTSTPLGVVLCLLAAILYASGVTLQKPVLRNVSPLQVTWLACLVGAIACLPFAPGLIEEAGAAEPVNLAWVLFLGIFPTSIGFTTWAYALARMSAGRAGAITYLIPPTAIVISWLLLGETPPVVAIVGGLLCIAGVIVARSSGLRVPTPLRRRSTEAS
ncbi:MAG TPA: DMT family transporter [Candidatus Limnocylindrales bacterium]|nr:DMT family transporter [Candidatus Limnocylindrales bacterium]